MKTKEDISFTVERGDSIYNQSLAESEECQSETYQQGELDDMMYACNIGEYEE